jgi:hypothetical protein
MPPSERTSRGAMLVGQQPRDAIVNAVVVWLHYTHIVVVPHLDQTPMRNGESELFIERGCRGVTFRLTAASASSRHSSAAGETDQPREVHHRRPVDSQRRHVRGYEAPC